MRIPADKIIVALDTHDEIKLNTLMKSLEGEKVWVKIGMEIFYSLGPKPIFLAKEKGHKVFLDLKLHDIPNTVEHALKALAKLPIDMVNVHAAGGKEMLLRSKEAVSSSAHSPLLIAVTQLTSTNQEQMNQEQGIPGEIAESVLRYAQLAHSCGLDGVVSSPLEVELIKKNLGSRFLTVTPGIRPTTSEVQDQKRITTPLEALKLGTDYMVIGRPITQALNPREALNQILNGN